MSRALIKNDASDDRALVPPRAQRQPGTINYVTPRGMNLLKDEIAAIIIGCGVGETISMRNGEGEGLLEISGIEYGE